VAEILPAADLYTHRRRCWMQVAFPCIGVIYWRSVAAWKAAGVTRQLLAFNRQQVCESRILDLNEVLAKLLKGLARLVGEHVEVTMNPAVDLAQKKCNLCVRYDLPLMCRVAHFHVLCSCPKIRFFTQSRTSAKRQLVLSAKFGVREEHHLL
jgi:hypothetical protein